VTSCFSLVVIRWSWDWAFASWGWAAWQEMRVEMRSHVKKGQSMSIKIPKISTSDTSGSLASKIIEIHPLVFSCWSRPFKIATGGGSTRTTREGPTGAWETGTRSQVLSFMAFSCNSQRVATSMLTTDISLPVLGHILDIIGIYILDYIIGLLYCQFSAASWRS